MTCVKTGWLFTYGDYVIYYMLSFPLSQGKIKNWVHPGI